MPRMTILSAAEQEAFESPPVFNSVQRKHYFDLPLALRRLATSLRAPTHEVCFLLICGYFKATKKFFALVDFRPRDVDYVAQQLDLSPEDVVIADYTDRTRQRHQRLILKYYGFHPFDHQVRGFLAEEITRMVRSQLKPKLMLGVSAYPPESVYSILGRQIARSGKHTTPSGDGESGSFAPASLPP